MKTSARVLSALLLTAGCAADGPPLARPPTADEIPEKVQVEGTTMEVGFAIARIAEKAEQPGFLIAKHPITVQRWRQCIGAGACGAPAASNAVCTNAGRGPIVGTGTSTVQGKPEAGNSNPAESRHSPEDESLRATRKRSRTIVSRSTYSEDDVMGALPITCITREQAVAYCEWVGGRLPTPEEWLLAARGESIQRYSWGRTRGRCTQHPQAADCANANDEVAAFSIGKHPAGASPSGVEDILLAPTELARTIGPSKAMGCQDADSFCHVGSLIEPGAIDLLFQSAATAPAKSPSDGRNPPGMRSATFGFRCVWEGSR